MRRAIGLMGILIMALSAVGCARLACEWRWRTEMAPRFERSASADGLTRRDLAAGRGAFKEDFLELCLSQ